MQNSELFQELVVRLEHLRNNLLPLDFSPTSDYTETQRDSARGYRLLVHAEIESFLESSVRSKLRSALSDWKGSRTPSRVLISLLALMARDNGKLESGGSRSDSDSSSKEEESPKKKKKKRPDVEHSLIFAAERFYARVKDSHGIRESHLIALLLPIGIQFDDLDPTWIIEMDEFGKMRGDIAHNSYTVASEIDPRDDFERVKRLVTGLSELDILIQDIDPQPSPVLRMLRSTQIRSTAFPSAPPHETPPS